MIQGAHSWAISATSGESDASRRSVAWSDDTDAMIRFEFTDDNNKAVALHIRRGVVEYVEKPDKYYRKPDFTLALTREVWAKLYLSQAAVKELAASGALKVTGDAAACDRVLDLFDKFDQAKNTLIPPGGIRPHQRD